MSSPVDPNDVMMTGENSFVRLSHDGGKTLADRWSHWRVLWCPAGPGHVLLAQAELTGGKPRIYSDNIAMTRWLQKAIESMLFPPTADLSTPVIEASFERSGDPARGRDGARRLRQRRDRDDLVRLQRPVRPHDGAGYREPADRRVQHVLSRSRGAGHAQRSGRGGERVARDEGRPAVVERVPRLVGDLGQAQGVTRPPPRPGLGWAVPARPGSNGVGVGEARPADAHLNVLHDATLEADLDVLLLELPLAHARE